MSAGGHDPGSPEDLAAQARPLSGRSSLEVGLDEIPKPPPELVDDLDNSEGGDAPADAFDEVAELDFCGDALPYRDFPLKYPFNWDGARVEVITARQLTTQQVGVIVRDAARAKRTPQLFDVYAVMTGYPARVLRALPSADGDPITEYCFDFLPPLLRPGSG